MCDYGSKDRYKKRKDSDVFDMGCCCCRPPKFLKEKVPVGEGMTDNRPTVMKNSVRFSEM